MSNSRGWLGPEDGCTCSKRHRKYHDSACPCWSNPVSDPAPTVDDMDDVSATPAEDQPGQPPAPAEVSYWQQQARDAAARHMLSEHPASSAPVTFSAPAPSPAEVSYWQQQARDAAARHMETSENDTPYVTLLKEELSAPDAFT